MSDINRIVPRVIEANENTRLFTMAHLVTSTPHPVSSVDALVVTPGLGENKRIKSAVSQWESQESIARFLLVAGTNGIEKRQIQPTIEFLQSAEIGLSKTTGVEVQIEADHTVAQTDWIINKAQQLGVTSMALFVSDWHITRAYSTLLKSMLKSGMRIPVFPVPVATSPSYMVPEYGVRASTMSAGEAERILKYQEKGDVATFSELTEYLDWLWKQDIVPIS